MASPKPFVARFAVAARRLAYAASVGLFLLICAQFYIPGQGFTYLVMFGGKQASQYLPELRAQNFYADRDSYGYDAQYYAQIAIDPNLGDPALRTAIDSLPYRARRILFCWTAYVLGGSHPWWVLNVFAVQNIVAWLLLAWVLLRWFSPTGWGNFLRWFATLFTFGMCFSVRGALVDGPSLLLIAIGMALLEAGRPWWSAAVLGVAGLGKETNILAATALAPADLRDGREWGRAIGRGLLVIAPLGVWLLCLKVWVGTGGDAGSRNFAWPFVGYFEKWQEALRPFFHSGSGVIGRAEVFVMIGLTVQWLFFALRPRWRDPWWRVGAIYALLMVVLGSAVWEGYPGAAPRVLLPMTLAFNILLPRGRRWWVLLILGNLLVWPSADILVPPGRESFQVRGSRELRVVEANGDELGARFNDRQWYGLERSYFDYWRWARGPATLVFHNPHPFPLTVDIRFRLKSSDERTVTVAAGSRVLWHGPTEQTEPALVFRNVVLPPGDTPWQFTTDRPAELPPNGDLRKVAFRVCDLVITIEAPAK
ncbi:MAG TPA: hypothetical protein VHE61_19745 [Opitutaceae bacterium]|nr:hypothetical protein [Opitutaceae bacterium]